MSNFFQSMEQETVRRLHGMGANFSPYLVDDDVDDDEDDDEEDNWEDDEVRRPNLNMMPRFKGYPEIFKYL